MRSEWWSRVWLVTAGVSGALAIGLGAYAQHGLGDDPHAAQLLETGTRYGMYHALALLAVAQLQRSGAALVTVAGCLFALGMVLFCGSLYVATLAGVPTTPLVPVGGTAFICGWVSITLYGFIKWKPPSV